MGGPKLKPSGYELEVRTFRGASQETYIVYRTRTGAFNVFMEVEAKAAALDCGASLRNKGPRANWRQIWTK